MERQGHAIFYLRTNLIILIVREKDSVLQTPWAIVCPLLSSLVVFRKSVQEPCGHI